jgi:hypothetical protein
VNVYYVDCTAGNVTATYLSSVYTYTDRVICFIRIDSSANSFIIDEISGTPTIIGNSVPYNTGMIQYDSIDLIYYNNVFYIKG